MGTYSEVCLASGFPVETGDDALGFVLARPLDHEPSRPAVYRPSPAFEWTPVGFPLKGAYDGYGGLEGLVEDAFSRHTLGLVRECMGDPAHPLDGEGPEGSDLGATWRALQAGRCLIPARDGDMPCGPRPMTLALVRRDVFEAMACGYREGGEGRPGSAARQDAVTIKASLWKGMRGAVSPDDVGGLRPACAPHGDLLDMVGRADPDALCREIATLLAFDGALRQAGVTYGPRAGGGQDERWEGVARHHATMSRVLARRLGR